MRRLSFFPRDLIALSNYICCFGHGVLGGILISLHFGVVTIIQMWTGRVQGMMAEIRIMTPR
jgi:hypothetical protein